MISRKESYRKSLEQSFAKPCNLIIEDQYGNANETIAVVSEREGMYRLGRYLRISSESASNILPFFLNPYHGKKKKSPSVPLAIDYTEDQSYLRWEVPKAASELLLQGEQLVVVPDSNNYDVWAPLYAVNKTKQSINRDIPIGEIHIDRTHQRVTSNDWLGAEKEILFRILSGKLDITTLQPFSGTVQTNQRILVGRNLRLRLLPSIKAVVQIGDEIRFISHVLPDDREVVGYLQKPTYCDISEPVSKYHFVTQPDGRRKFEIIKPGQEVTAVHDWAYGNLPIEQTTAIEAKITYDKYVIPKERKYVDLRFECGKSIEDKTSGLFLIPRTDPLHMYEWLSIESHGKPIARFRKIQMENGNNRLQGSWQGPERQSWYDYYISTKTGKDRSIDLVYPQPVVIPATNKLSLFSGNGWKYTVYLSRSILLDPQKKYDALPIPDENEILKCQIIEHDTKQIIQTLSIHSEKTTYPRRRVLPNSTESIQEIIEVAEKNIFFKGGY